MNPEQNKKTTLEAWQTSAPYWDKYRPLITRMFAPVTKGLIDEARISSGHRVLDIGGGAGEPSFTISGIVGRTGAVMFTDPSPGMFESAKAEAARLGLTNIQFMQCSADDLPFADDTFDAAVGRFSAMFFPDPARAVREVLRVVRKEGQVSFAVWGPKEANPFFSAINDVFDRLAGSVDENPDAPDPFRFAVAGALPAIMKEAGAEQVTERRLVFRIQAAISFEEFWRLRTEMSESLRRQVAGLTAETLETIRLAAGAAAAQYFVDGKMSFPAEALIVSGTKRKAETP